VPHSGNLGQQFKNCQKSKNSFFRKIVVKNIFCFCFYLSVTKFLPLLPPRKDRLVSSLFCKIDKIHVKKEKEKIEKVWTKTEKNVKKSEMLNFYP